MPGGASPAPTCIEEVIAETVGEGLAKEAALPPCPPGFYFIIFIIYTT